jgi:hypothetical protein
MLQTAACPSFSKPIATDILRTALGTSDVGSLSSAALLPVTPAPPSDGEPTPNPLVPWLDTNAEPKVLFEVLIEPQAVTDRLRVVLPLTAQA